MSKISPIALSHYNFDQQICDAEEVKSAPLGTPQTFKTALAPRRSEAISLLARHAQPTLSPSQIRLGALSQNLSAEARNPLNVALALAAPALLLRAQKWGSIAEASLLSLPARSVMKQTGSVLASGLMAACASAPEGEDYIEADASLPPSSEDLDCNNLYDKINEATSAAELANLVQTLEFPELDVTHNGNNGIAVIADSEGTLVSHFTPNSPVAWVREGDKLFVLTANQSGAAFNPATLFVYALNNDGNLALPGPLSTSQYNGKALLLGQAFNPTNMSLVKLEDGEWLGIALGAISNNRTLLIDPAGPFNPYNPQIVTDYCATKDYAPNSSEVDAGGQ